MERKNLLLQSTACHKYIYRRKGQFAGYNPYFGKGDIELPFQRASLHCDNLVEPSSQGQSQADSEANEQPARQATVRMVAVVICVFKLLPNQQKALKKNNSKMHLEQTRLH